MQRAMSRTLTAYFFLAILSSIVSLSTRKLLPHEKLVKSMKYHKMDENVIFAVIEAAEQSIRRRNICSPPMFFNPTDSNAILESFKDIVDVKVSCFGGYDQAERTRTFFCNSDPYMLEREDVMKFVSAIKLEGNFLFDKATRNDFLTSVTNGASLLEDQIGDIILTGDRGAHIIIAPEAEELALSSIKQIRSVSVDCRSISLSELAVRPSTTKELTCIETSRRLDALASAGFSMSRTKLVKLIESGEVLVNWKEVTNPAATVQEKSIIAIRGHGRVTVDSITDTSKGKLRVKMKRVT